MALVSVGTHHALLILCLQYKKGYERTLSGYKECNLESLHTLEGPCSLYYIKQSEIKQSEMISILNLYIKDNNLNAMFFG